MLSFIKFFGASFQAAAPEEIHGDLGNPGRGWYRIYTYRLEDPDFEQPVRYPGESLALVLFNVGAYKDRDLDEAALRRMDEMLERFEALDFAIILRICYDTEGKGMVREPSLFSQVKKHIAQLAPLLLKHEEHIFVYQGLLVGSWGEMHESRYVLPGPLKELTETFLRETQERIPLAVRKPVQYRIAFTEGEKRHRMGFFNDGMLGSETHVGTFAPKAAGRRSWQEPWSPEEECGFMAPFLKDVPYGGEVLMAAEPLTPQETISTLRKLQVSYLNSTHDAGLLSAWRETPYENGTLYDYVGERLGYRFLVKRVEVKHGKMTEIALEIGNEGFGHCMEDAVVEIFCQPKGDSAGRRTLGQFDENLRELAGGNAVLMKRRFPNAFAPENKAPDAVELYARILRKRDGAVLRFAQKSRDGALLLGTLRI